MSIAVPLFLNLLTAIGLGAWWRVPSPSARLLLGAVTIPAVLLVADMGLGFGLLLPGWGLVGAGLLGLVVKRPFPVGFWRHPIVVLPFLVAAVAAAGGDFVYRPHSWDEFSAWLTWPREAYLDNSFLSPEATWSGMGYTQGLPALMVFPQLFFPTFDAGRSAAPFLILYAGLMGLVWEEITHHEPADRGSWAAWLVVLLLLAAEAAWTLVPQLMLVETPQIYLIAAVLLLLLRAARGDDWAWWTAGVAAAACYLIKAPAAALGPALLVGWAVAALTDSRERSLLRPVVLAGPLVLAYLGWQALVPPVGAGQCISNPLAALAGWEQGGRAVETAHRMLGGMAEYTRRFKLPLSAAALIGLAAGFWTRRETRPMLAVLVAWLAAYGSGLLLTFAFCFSDYERDQLASLPRYTSVALRVIHVVGLVLLAEWGLSRIAARGWNPTRAAAVLTLFAALYQVWAVVAALDNARRRTRETPEAVALVAQVLTEADSLSRLVRERFPGQVPTVALITQGGQGFEWVIARQAALGLSRPGHWRFRLREGFSWGERADDPWRMASGAEAARLALMRAEVIWPMTMDAWMIDTLAPLIDDPACRSRPEAYFLVRRNDRAVVCVRKDQTVRP